MPEFYFYNVFEYSVRLPLFSIPVRLYFLIVPSVLSVVQLWLAYSGLVPAVIGTLRAILFNCTVSSYCGSAVIGTLRAGSAVISTFRAWLWFICDWHTQSMATPEEGQHTCALLSVWCGRRLPDAANESLHALVRQGGGGARASAPLGPWTAFDHGHMTAWRTISCYGKQQTVMSSSPSSDWSWDAGFKLAQSILIWFWSVTGRR